MKDLIIEHNEKKFTYHIPESIKEMTGTQIIEAIKYRTNKLAGKPAGDVFFTKFCGIEPAKVKLLYPFHKYSIEQCFEYLFTEEWDVAFNQQKFRTITIGEIKYHGYNDNFGNTTWEEFIWADQYFINKDYKTAIAILYREKRKKYDGETDKRMPFTNYSIENRKKEIDKLDDATIAALVLQYRAMRKASLEEKYPEIFPEPFQSDQNEMPEPELDVSDNFSWVKVHRNIMGNNIQNEKDYLQLNVHTILNRLNDIVIENRRIKHKSK